ncbi:MAG: hypothetical protein H0U76_16810 [Ktedonobacteraceae bacterium]|nr:hypothetical protein [Ktedonobacteraceae bacterium]
MCAFPLAVWKNPRIALHGVFEGLAQRSQTSVGRFYGCKLQGIINDRGEVLAVQLTAGNVDDRRIWPPDSLANSSGTGALSQRL